MNALVDKRKSHCHFIPEPWRPSAKNAGCVSVMAERNSLPVHTLGMICLHVTSSMVYWYCPKLSIDLLTLSELGSIFAVSLAALTPPARVELCNFTVDCWGEPWLPQNILRPN